MYVTVHLVRPTRKFWTGSPQTLLYLVLHRTGFTKLFRSPGKLVRSYRTVSPLPRDSPNRHPSHFDGCQTIDESPGGLLSAALSFTSPRLHVMERPALWCSDFPPDVTIQRPPGLLSPKYFYTIALPCNIKCDCTEDTRSMYCPAAPQYKVEGEY